MSSELEIRPAIEEAKEKKWNWLKVAESYEQALRSKSLSGHVTGEIWENIGFSHRRSFRQTKNHKEFKRLGQLAVEAYEKAAKLFEKANNQG